MPPIRTSHTPRNSSPPVPSYSLTNDRPLQLPLVPRGPANSLQAPLAWITVGCMLIEDLVEMQKDKACLPSLFVLLLSRVETSDTKVYEP